MKLHDLDLPTVRHVDLGFGTALNLKEGKAPGIAVAVTT